MFMGCDGEEICHVEEEDEHSHDGKGHSLLEGEGWGGEGSEQW